MPKTRFDFWNEKFKKNVERDWRDVDVLRKAGWNVLIIWECQTKNSTDLNALLIDATFGQVNQIEQFDR